MREPIGKATIYLRDSADTQEIDVFDTMRFNPVDREIDIVELFGGDVIIQLKNKNVPSYNQMRLLPDSFISVYFAMTMYIHRKYTDEQITEALARVFNIESKDQEIPFEFGIQEGQQPSIKESI